MNARVVLYRLAQWLWGFPQSAAGGVLYLITRGSGTNFHGALAKKWRRKGSVSLGMFLFISDGLSEEESRRVLVHEYGHSIQSLIFGPLYLLAVGIPSAVWAGLPALKRLREKKNRSYYSVYPECWANVLGERFTGECADK